MYHYSIIDNKNNHILSYTNSNIITKNLITNIINRYGYWSTNIYGYEGIKGYIDEKEWLQNKDIKFLRRQYKIYQMKKYE